MALTLTGTVVQVRNREKTSKDGESYVERIVYVADGSMFPKRCRLTQGVPDLERGDNFEAEVFVNAWQGSQAIQLDYVIVAAKKLEPSKRVAL